MMKLYKYPRTHHLEGSRFQPGDEELDSIPFSQIQGRHIVVEEKLDGANTGISFDDEGRLFLQSRGHFLDGGPRERQFDLVAAYNARVRIVYLETSPDRLYEQNRRRDEAVPNAVINRLLDQWEVPDLTEAHEVDCVHYY